MGWRVGEVRAGFLEEAAPALHLTGLSAFDTGLSALTPPGGWSPSFLPSPEHAAYSAWTTISPSPAGSLNTQDTIRHTNLLRKPSVMSASYTRCWAHLHYSPQKQHWACWLSSALMDHGGPVEGCPRLPLGSPRLRDSSTVAPVGLVTDWRNTVVTVSWRTCLGSFFKELKQEENIAPAGRGRGGSNGKALRRVEGDEASGAEAWEATAPCTEENVSEVSPLGPDGMMALSRDSSYPNTASKNRKTVYSPKHQRLI